MSVQHLSEIESSKRDPRLSSIERDAVRREPFALRSSYFVNELTDDLSTAMVKKIQNRYGVEIWPWERSN